MQEIAALGPDAEQGHTQAETDPADLDALGIRVWLSRLAPPLEQHMKPLEARRRTARSESQRELARRRLHALRLHLCEPLAEPARSRRRHAELARRGREKALHPCPDHWKSY